MVNRLRGRRAKGKFIVLERHMRWSLAVLFEPSELWRGLHKTASLKKEVLERLFYGRPFG